MGGQPASEVNLGLSSGVWMNTTARLAVAAVILGVCVFSYVLTTVVVPPYKNLGGKRQR